jgi:hypothetical protein
MESQIVADVKIKKVGIDTGINDVQSIKCSGHNNQQIAVSSEIILAGGKSLLEGCHV